MIARVGLALLCLLCLCLLTGDAHQPTIAVTVTAYTYTGSKTSTGRKPAPGMLAISRDLERYLTFGDRVLLLGSVYTIQDRMHKRWHRRVDIFMPSRSQARHFGIQHARLTPLPE